MAGARGRLIALALAGALLAPADARDSDPMRELVGAYRETGGWIQIIPVDARHAYVHLYFLGGVGHDLISEIKEIMTLERSTLTFRQAPADGDPGCFFTLRRDRGFITWHAPEDAPCTTFANGHFPGMFMDGRMSVARRRPVSRTRRYPGEGYGYASTVTHWRERRRS